jgi:hypothetical protein
MLVKRYKFTDKRVQECLKGLEKGCCYQSILGRYLDWDTVLPGLDDYSNNSFRKEGAGVVMSTGLRYQESESSNF